MTKCENCVNLWAILRSSWGWTFPTFLPGLMLRIDIKPGNKGDRPSPVVKLAFSGVPFLIFMYRDPYKGIR